MSKIQLSPHFRSDLMASLVVFVVAVPLSLGIALASGTSPVSGLIAAVVGGIVVGALSGAPLMVSGPAAGLTVLAFQLAQELGIAGLALATLIAGAIQVALSFARCGWIFQIVPKSILNGMLAAIGLIILLGQLHVLMGAPMPQGPLNALSALPGAFADRALGGSLILGLSPAFMTGLIAVAVLLIWPKLPRLNSLPAALPAVALSTLAALQLDLDRIQLEGFLASMGSSVRGLASYAANPDLVKVALSGFGIAMVASAESLLTARAVELIDHNKEHKTDLNRELLAQGIGNSISAVLGGLPITGVIVRSAANIDAGARTRASAMLHGAWVIVFVALFPGLLNLIPMAALAAVLVVTGAKLLNLKGLLATLRDDPREGSLWALTLVLIVATNLLTGLSLAIVAAGALYYREIITSIRSRKAKLA